MKRTSSETTVDICRRDNDYSLQFNRWILKSIGAWPEFRKNSMIKNILINILRLACHSLMVYTIVSSTLYVLFEEKDLRLRLKAIGPTSHIIMGGINYCSLLHNNDRIRAFIEHMETDWRMAKREQDREVMLRNARIGRVIAAVCTLIMQVGVISYNIARGMSRITVVIGNKTIETGGLPCASYNKIVDTRLSPVYEVVLAVQCLSTIVVNNVTVGACSLAAVFAMHASGQLNVVMLRLEELVAEKQDLQLKLANIVEHHLRALR